MKAMKIARLLVVSTVVAAALAICIYGSAHIMYRPTVSVFKSASTFAVPIALFSMPFALAAFIALYGRHREDIVLSTAAFTAAAATLCAAGAAEFLTWRAMFYHEDGSSTAAVGFFTVPVLSVVVTALGFIVGLGVGRCRARRVRTVQRV